MKSQQNAIFLSFDENYLAYAKPCLNSLFCNYPEHPQILVNYRGRFDHVKEFTTRENIRFLDLDELKFPPGPVKSQTVFDRFHLWGGGFNEFNKILHLDADALVLQPLQSLFDNDGFFITRDDQELARVFRLHDQLLCSDQAKGDKAILQTMLRQEQLEYFASPGSMANAGIFTIPRHFRSNEHYRNLLTIASRYERFIAYGDQSIISIWCEKNGIFIQDKPEFNCQIRFLYKKDLHFEDIRILHFSGEAKFFKKLRISNKEKAVYGACDNLRLFYRKDRKPGEDQVLRNQIIETIAEITRR